MEEIADKPHVGKRKVGRPKIRSGERLSRTLAFRVTYKEELGVKRRAAELGLDWCDYLRELVRKDQAAHPAAPAPDQITEV